MKKALLITLFVFCIATCGFAQEQKKFSAHDILYSGPELNFFAEYLLGKEFIQDSVRKLDEGKIETVFHLTSKFANLNVAPEGFTFQILYQVKQTLYDLDVEGKRIEPGRVMDRNIVVKYMFGPNKSTGKVVGNQQIIFNDSGQSTFGMAGNLILFMDGKKLVLLRPEWGFSDYFAAEEKFKCKTSRSRTEFSVEDGNIVRTVTREQYNVNPETLEITSTGEKDTTIDTAPTSPLKK